MRRIALLVVFLTMSIVAPSWSANAQPAPTPAPTEETSEPSNETDFCDILGAGVEGLTCRGITGAVDAGTGAVVASGAQAALSAVVDFVADGTGWLLGQLTGLIDSSTRPTVTSTWFRQAYADMAAVAVLGLLPFLLLAIAQGIIRQDPGQLVRSTLVFVPVAALGTGAAVVVVDMLVTITDGMSDWVGRSMGEELHAFAEGLTRAVLSLTVTQGVTGAAAGGFAALLATLVVGFATFVIWLELILRQAAIYVAVLFLPLGFMALVWPATAHWLRRLVQGLVAIILSKFVIVSIMALAATALDADVADEGYGVVVGGGAMLSLAALAPYVLLRLIPIFDTGMAGSLEGAFRRPTAAVAPPGGSRSQVSHMIAQRLRGNTSHAGASSGGQSPSSDSAGDGGGSGRSGAAAGLAAAATAAGTVAGQASSTAEQAAGSGSPSGRPTPASPPSDAASPTTAAAGSDRSPVEDGPPTGPAAATGHTDAGTPGRTEAADPSTPQPPQPTPPGHPAASPAQPADKTAAARANGRPSSVPDGQTAPAPTEADPRTAVRHSTNGTGPEEGGHS